MLAPFLDLKPCVVPRVEVAFVALRLMCVHRLLQVESFVIDQSDFDEVRLEASKFLLSPEEAEHAVDPETQIRLEALLEAAG